MNSFCKFCVGGSKDKEIQYCNDKYCPFYEFRFADISHEDEVEISKKLLGEMGIVQK